LPTPALAARSHATGRELWPHQRDAADAAVKTLNDTARATVVAACGSGKTAIGAQVAAEVVPDGGRLLFAAPNLELLSQTLSEYHRTGRRALGRVIAVCSDRGAVYQSRVDLGAQHAEVTTDPRDLAAALARPGPATVLCTYQSLDVVRDAHSRHALARWDLAIADEAHRTAGVRGKSWGIFHEDGEIPAARRLYLTATPRIYDGEGDERVISMDDEAVFGPVAYRLTFAEAIERGLLADYRVLVPVITDAEILRLVEGAGDAPFLSSGSSALDPGVLAVQVALLRAAAQYGAKRMITYHGRVADAHGFARTLHAAVDLLEPGERPAKLTCLAVDGRQDVATRRPILARLGAHDQDTVIVANARVLGEGVDIPAVDAVAFLTARDSPETTVQAVGRALRTGGKSGKVATIIIPIVLGPEETAESALDGSAYAGVWAAIRALRAHDERLARSTDQLGFRLGRAVYQPGAQKHPLPPWLSFTGVPVPEGFADAITLRMVRESAAPWEQSYGHAVAYHALHGDLAPHAQAEPRLHSWLYQQRKARQDGALSAERIERLDAIAMVWSPFEEKWARGMAAARDYHDTHGHLRVPPKQTWGEAGYRLGRWVSDARASRRRGALPATRIAQLDALGFVWSPEPGKDQAWARNLAAAQAYHREHGHLDAPRAVALGKWLSVQRAYRREGKLSAQRIAALDVLAMRWNPVQSAFEQGLAAAQEYHREHGHLNLANSAMWGDPPYPLGAWLSRMRLARKAATLDAAQIAALDALGMSWAKFDESWNAHLDAVAAYQRRHGTLPASRVTSWGQPPLNLYAWLHRQRREQRKQTLYPQRAARLAEVLGPNWTSTRHEPPAPSGRTSEPATSSADAAGRRAA
jgi:superfamily II DNA or RNA helicase